MLHEYELFTDFVAEDIANDTQRSLQDCVKDIRSQIKHGLFIDEDDQLVIFLESEILRKVMTFFRG